MGKTTFERQPIAEVSFGVAFLPLKELRTSHFGLFWSRLQSEFPQTVDAVPIGDFGGDMGGMVSVPGWFPLPRVQFIHRNREQLVQLQPNRFYFNWRRLQPITAYPRFASLEPM